MPSLINLDSAPVSAEEAETAKKKGQFFQTADGGNAQTQVVQQQQQQQSGSASANQQSSSSSNVAAAAGGAGGSSGGGRKTADDLFADLDREITQQRGDGVIFGIQRHVYTGKSSEGNRFIGNDMLR